MKMVCKSLFKFFRHHGEISKKIFYFTLPLVAILIYCLFNSVIYFANSPKQHLEQLFFSTSEASAAYASGIFSALSLILLIFNFIYQSKDSKKKDELYLSQQFSQIFNNRFDLYKTLLRNIEGNVVIINDQGMSTYKYKNFVGITFLEKNFRYVSVSLKNGNIVNSCDCVNNNIKYCSLSPFAFEYFNEPFYELFSLLKYTCNSKSIPNEEKEIYFERIRNLTKIELIWLILFCVSNSEINNNLSLLRKSKVLTKLSSPYDLSNKFDFYILLMDFLRKNNLITDDDLFKK